MTTSLAGLLEKYKNGTITPAEWQLLREAVDSNRFHSLINDDILELLQKGAPAADWKQADAEAILQSILAAKEQSPEPIGPELANPGPPSYELPDHRIRHIRTWSRYAAAIILLLGAAGYGWFRYQHHSTNGGITSQPQPNPIKPASNSAILTLADGSTVTLDSTGNRILAAQGGARVRLNNGQLIYDQTAAATHDPVQGTTAPATTATNDISYNTVTTTRGNQFHIILPDGTKVYLNAASTLRYPTVFTGSRRKVEITGEAWFEVAKVANKPFIVSIDKETEVEVLGTSFDVNAYKDDNRIEATLVEGLIRVKKGDATALVNPGGQARIGKKISLVKDADLDKALAWKNGIFNFEDVGLREMMRQLERWYDIDVEYEPNVPDEKFFGKTSRKVDLATVLEALKGFGLHCEMISARKLIVKQ